MKVIKVLIIFLFLSNTTTVAAQDSKDNNYQKFARLFALFIPHPVDLSKACKGTVCLLKITVDSAKNVTKMQLSDSADSLFKVEFDKHKSTLRTSLLVNYLKEKYKDNSCPTYIVPVSYSVVRANCVPPAILISNLVNYARFNGTDLTGNAIFLEPIGAILSDTISN